MECTQQQDWLEALPGFQKINPISSDSRDENEGAPLEQPRSSQQQALITTKYSQLAQNVLRRAQMQVNMRRIPEERAADSGGNSEWSRSLAFLESLPVGQRRTRHCRGAFASIRPVDGGSDVPEPDPESDSYLHLHPETVDALRYFGIWPRDQGQRVPWDADLVFPDPIMINQSGDSLILHETLRWLFLFINKGMQYCNIVALCTEPSDQDSLLWLPLW